MLIFLKMGVFRFGLNSWVLCVYFSGVFARGKNLLRKGSFPLALSFFQTFSSSRVRGGEEWWGLGSWNPAEWGNVSCVFARGKNLLRKGSFPLALFFFQTFSSGRVRGGRSGWVWGWIKKKTFSWVARYCKEEKVRKKIPASNYSPALCCAVPSSRGLLSIVFGMGT